MPNVFGFETPKRCPLVIPFDEKTGLPLDEITQEKLDFDPATGSTKVNIDDKIALYALIQTYKDQCGVEYIRSLVAKGMLSPESIADDGKHGGDAAFPLDVNDAYRSSMKSRSSLSVLAKELGIEINEKTTDEDIAKAIVKRITPAQPANPEGGDK